MSDIFDGGDAFSDFSETPNVGSFSPASKTAADVMQTVKRQFGDESGVQLEDADLIRWINDAQDEIVSRNKVLKAVSTLSATPNQATYKFPAERIHRVDSLHFGGQRIPNMSFAQAEETVIGASDPTAQGFPQLWYEYAGTFTFWPAPATGDDITLYYTRQATPVTGMTSVLSIPDTYYRNVINYVMQQAYEMDTDMQAAATKREQFDTSLNQMAQEERSAQSMTYDTLTVYDN